MNKNVKKYIPFVINKLLEKKEFDGNLIYESLIIETSLSIIDAKFITEQTTRKIILMCSNIKHITSPMIREMVCVTLLQYGFEKERLEYTRIGFPRYDLKKMIENNNSYETDIKIVKHIRTENSNVNNLIKSIENGVNNKKDENSNS